MKIAELYGDYDTCHLFEYQILSVLVSNLKLAIKDERNKDQIPDLQQRINVLLERMNRFKRYAMQGCECNFAFSDFSLCKPLPPIVKKDSWVVDLRNDTDKKIEVETQEVDGPREVRYLLNGTEKVYRADHCVDCDEEENEGENI